MASITLLAHEVELAHLPSVCAACGEEGIYRTSKTTYYSTSKINIISMFVGRLLRSFLSERIVYTLPFCHRHKSYWMNRTLKILALLLVPLLLSIAGVLVASQRPPEDATGIRLHMAAFFSMLLALFIAVLIRDREVRVIDFCDRQVTLSGLSDTFVTAVIHYREAGPPVPWKTTELENIDAVDTREFKFRKMPPL